MKDYKVAWICEWESKMTEANLNQTGAELGIQDGGTHEIIYPNFTLSQPHANYVTLIPLLSKVINSCW